MFVESGLEFDYMVTVAPIKEIEKEPEIVVPGVTMQAKYIFKTGVEVVLKEPNVTVPWDRWIK